MTASRHHIRHCANGLTLIEALVTVAIMATVAVSIYGFARFVVVAAQTSRAALIATELIEQQVEIARNLPYASVGIAGGIPNGVLQHNKTITSVGLNFQMTTTVRNVDDPFDGTLGGSPNDTAPADFKLVEVSVICTNCKDQTPYTMTTTESPKNLENASTNGALFIQVLDAAGNPVVGASVHIVNSTVSPNLVVDDVTDDQGWLRVVDVPPGTNAYAVTVSKSGYSTERTYSVGDPVGNSSPNKRHATVATQQVTQITFGIDRVSTMNIASVTDTCAPVASVPFTLTGAKLVGTNGATPPTNYYKYSQNLTTDASGILGLPSMEWDSYTLGVTSTTKDFRGLSVVNPFTLAPATTQNVNIVVAPKTPSAVLVTVKDTAGQPINGATVALQRGGNIQTQTTDTDFNAGTYTNTAVTGAGVNASVQLATAPGWLAVSNRGGSITQTTDADFNAGALSGTVVSGSGNLGTVSLGTLYNWITKTSPQSSNAYNDVYIYNSSFGFAVGNGGVIAKWDGVSWVSVSSPVFSNLYGVAVVSASDAWAVGASGNILHWNGSAWSSATYGSSTFRHVRMTSSTAGWAVADGGVIYKWNGATWAADANTASDNLDGVAGTAPPAAAPGSVSETTDVNFNDGTFASTAVAGSGAGASVALAASNSWATRTSPQSTNPYNEVSLFSPTFGFAVGNGGVIAKWDGASWASSTSGVPSNLYGVAVVSASDAWAAGASGKILHWNGSAWSSSTYGSSTFRHVRMTSASAGWAVADGGVIYKWNGATWAPDPNTGSDNLTGVAGTAPPAAVPGSVSETTDANFVDGTFASTAVAGSGAGASVALAASNSWANVTSPVFGTLNDVFIYSSNLGFAVGDAGTVIKWNGTAWATDVSFPDTSDVRGIAIISTTDAWAVGSSGRFWHWNGSTWTRHTDTGSQVWYDVACPASNTCFAVTDSGVIERWNGTSWSQAVDIGNQSLYGISCTSTSYCRATGGSGYIFTWDGSNWTQPIDTGSQTWRSISMVDANTGWIVGDGGNIYRCTSGNCDANAEWVSSTSGTTHDLTSISALSSSLAYAVGDGGTILKWNGSAWSADTSSTVNSLTAIDAFSSSFMSAVGVSGTVIEYAPHYPTGGTRTYVSSALDAGAAASWGTLSWTETLPAGTDLTLATQTSADGASWSGWSAEQSTSAGGAIVSPRGRYVQYRATFANGSAFTTPSLDSISLSYDTSAPSLFAVSSAGTIIGRNGTYWSQVASFAGLNFAAIDCVSSTDCWAVADSGRIVRWDGATWSQFVDLGNQSLASVGLASTSLGWATDTAGGIFRWNGTSWAAESSPTGNALYGVDPASTTFAVAVGASGTIVEYSPHYPTGGTRTYVSSALDAGAAASWGTLSWTETLPAGTDLTLATQTSADGASWSGWSAEQSTSAGGAIVSPRGRYVQYRATFANGSAFTTPSLDSISLSYDTSAPSLFAVSSAGTIIGRNGTYWSQVASFAGLALSSIDCVSAADCWATANGGRLVRWDGTSWAQLASLGSQSFTDVSLASTSLGWTVDTTGKIFRWNGTSWSADTSPTSNALYGVNALSANVAVAVGASGTIIEYASHNATTGTIISSVLDSGTAGMTWNTAAWTSAVPANTTLTVSTRASDTSPPTGSFTNVDLIGGETENASIDPAGGTGRYLQYEITFTSSASPTSATLDDITLTYNAAFTSQINATDMISTSDGWAVGAGGTIRRWNGSNWSSYSSPTSNTLFGLKMNSTSDGWAVGAGGTIIRWNGTSWSTVTSPTTNQLRAVEMVSSSDGWAVGAGGTIIRWNGTSWSTKTSPTTNNLNGLSLSASGSGWAVGDANTFISLSGTTWSLGSGPFASSVDLFGVKLVTSSNGQAVGKNGSIAKWNGTAWSSVASPVTQNLYAVDFVTSSDAWAVGAVGTMIHWNGTAWLSSATVTTKDLHGLSSVTTNDIWSSGANDTLLHYTLLYFTSGTFASSTIDAGSSVPWMTLSWTPVVPSGTAITLATRTGNSLPLSGAWSAELNQPDGSTIVSPNGRYFQYRITETTTDQTVTPQVAEVSVYFGTLGSTLTQETGSSYGGQTNWSDGPGLVTFDGSAKFFNSDGNIEYATPSGQLSLKKTAGVYATTGNLTSATFDLGAGNSYGSLYWLPVVQPAETGTNSVEFQVATNNDNATWNFTGPDGTAATYYTSPGTAIASANNGNRYFRYRVFLTTANTAFTPTVTDINFIYTPACAPAGEALYQGLTTGNFNVSVTKSGYSSFSKSPYTVSTDWIELVVTLTHS